MAAADQDALAQPALGKDAGGLVLGQVHKVARDDGPDGVRVGHVHERLREHAQHKRARVGRHRHPLQLDHERRGIERAHVQVAQQRQVRGLGQLG